jgi:hypothetical protein
MAFPRLLHLFPALGRVALIVCDYQPGCKAVVVRVWHSYVKMQNCQKSGYYRGWERWWRGLVGGGGGGGVG